jgi:hypothetical protein
LNGLNAHYTLQRLAEEFASLRETSDLPQAASGIR